jgi:hypothetical protein
MGQGFIVTINKLEIIMGAFDFLYYSIDEYEDELSIDSGFLFTVFSKGVFIEVSLSWN